jgi:membrane carboxypeptidase/penicillin-binding protein PbpC
MPVAPGAYNPFTIPDLAKERQRVVLGLMQSMATSLEQERLSAETIPLSFNPNPYPIEAPHFTWLIKDQIDKLTFTGILNPRQSLIVRTTLDLDVQHLAENVLKRRIEEFKNEDAPISHNVNNAALVVIDPHIGEVLALVGSEDYFDESIDGALDMALRGARPVRRSSRSSTLLALDPTRPTRGLCIPRSSMYPTRSSHMMAHLIRRSITMAANTDPSLCAQRLDLR